MTGDILGKVKLAPISLLVTMHWDFLHYQTHRNAISSLSKWNLSTGIAGS